MAFAVFGALAHTRCKEIAGNGLIGRSGTADIPAVKHF
jgi:hypothetical protein